MQQKKIQLGASSAASADRASAIPCRGPGRRAGSAARRRRWSARAGHQSASVAPVWRRGRRRCAAGRGSGGRAGRGLARRVERPCRASTGPCGSPVAGAGNSSPSRPPVGVLDRCACTSGSRCGGMATSRVPASVFGVPTMNSPSTRTTPRRIVHDAALGVDVVAAQLGQLAEPQAAPRGQQHHQPVALGHRLREGLELGEGRGLDLLHALGVARAADVARVEVDQLVADGVARIVRSSP